jgi:predicted phosphodiesterase
MRYLVCGDIHGNLPALELMLAKEKDNYDQFICHGDVVNYGPWSDDCVKLLNTIEDSILLKGNHEIYFLSGIYNGSNIIAKTFFNYCYDKFTQFELIKKYGHSIRIGDYIIQHTILDKYIFLDTKIDQLDQDYIIGHSHQQYNITIGNNKLVNTGSVGQNRTYINCINYILYDDKKNVILLQNQIYDHNLIIKKLVSESYPEICVNYYRNKNILK